HANRKGDRRQERPQADRTHSNRILNCSVFKENFCRCCARPPKRQESAVTHVNSPPRGRSAIYYVRPGEHSHNAHRREPKPAIKGAALRRLRLMLLIIGILGAGYYCYTLCDQYVYQSFENWAFDQHIAGHKAVTFADYIREQTPFGFAFGKARAPVARPAAPAVSPRP